MFRRILIANRGEIAVRVIRACRELGIESVAVYSDADAGALHVSLADRSVRIGAAPAAQSYLSADAVLAAARETGAEAIHPGYGFLSENRAFAAACAAAGVTFVGPPAEVIVRMGSKISARQFASQAGVPVVPGETPVDQSDDGLAAAARRLSLRARRDRQPGDRRPRVPARRSRSCHRDAARGDRGGLARHRAARPPSLAVARLSRHTGYAGARIGSTRAGHHRGRAHCKGHRYHRPGSREVLDGGDHRSAAVQGGMSATARSLSRSTASCWACCGTVR